MKQVYKIHGIISIVAIIGLIAISCDSSSGGGTDPCKDGHTFPAWIAPTCTVAGNSVRTCINCTQTDTRLSGFDALGHQWDDEDGIVTSATCTEEGGTKRTCTREGCTEYEIIGDLESALGHEGLTPAFSATCTTSGNESESGPCRRPGCGEVIIGTVILPLRHLDNDWDWLTYSNGKVNCNRSDCPGGFAVIGDTGPAGGKIFYLTTEGFTMTDDNSIAYYLEAAPANMATVLNWPSPEFYPPHYGGTGDWLDIPGTETAIGTGRKNTELILELDATAPAAYACKNYTVAGYETFTDWFLPSKDELNELYKRHMDLGITAGYFWSSSQFPVIDCAWIQYLVNGLQVGGTKSVLDNVRAIRAF